MTIERRHLFIGVLFVLTLALGIALGRSCSSSGTDAGGDDAHAHSEDEAAGEYICPMHPQIRQEGEGTCPICGMDLVPVDNADSSEDSMVDSTMLSDEAVALSGLRTSRVERRHLNPTLRTYGVVETSEAQDARITAWAAGRIERLYVEATGEEVRRGQRLVRIYSPELAVAVQTMQDARADLEAAQGNPILEELARGTLSAARRQLQNAGLSPDSFNPDSDGDRITLRAPATGTIIERHVREGDYVNEGAPIVTLSSLSRVWVQLEIYERDIARVHSGQSVELRDRAGNAFSGVVDFISPTLDPQQRTLRARVEIANPERGPRLRPGQLLDADIMLHRAEASSEESEDEESGADTQSPPAAEPVLSVPISAVLWTGERSIIYVKDATTSPPSYLAIEVQLGQRDEDYWEIREGLYPGEEVVTNAAFVVDANLQLEGGGGMMGADRRSNNATGDGETPEEADSPATGGHHDE